MKKNSAECLQERPGTATNWREVLWVSRLRV